MAIKINCSEYIVRNVLKCVYILTVTLNGTNNDTAISTLYLQICGLSHKQRIDLFNGKEPVFIDDNQWRVSSCTLQNV